MCRRALGCEWGGVRVRVKVRARVRFRVRVRDRVTVTVRVRFRVRVRVRSFFRCSSSTCLGRARLGAAGIGAGL